MSLQIVCFMYICKQHALACHITCAPTSCLASLVNHHGELFHVAIDGLRLTFVLHLLRHCKPLIGYVQLLYTSHCVCCLQGSVVPEKSKPTACPSLPHHSGRRYAQVQ